MMLSFMTDDQGIGDKSIWYNKHDLNIPRKLILFNRLLKSEVYFGHFQETIFAVKVFSHLPEDTMLPKSQFL